MHEKKDKTTLRERRSHAACACPPRGTWSTDIQYCFSLGGAATHTLVF